MYRAAADREDAAAIALLHAEDGTAVPVRLAAAA
jgi:hypothetical protein